MRQHETGVKRLSTGLQTTLLAFERAVRQLATPFYREREDDAIAERARREQVYLRAKRAHIRAIRRLEGTLPRDNRRKRATATELHEAQEAEHGEFHQ